MKYRYYEIDIKEKSGASLHSSYAGCVDEDFLVKFYGLDKDDVESYEIKEMCCLCNRPLNGESNNAAPLMDGYCCDECNKKRVIPERLKRV